MRTISATLATLQEQTHRNPKTKVTVEFDRPIFNNRFAGSLKYQANRYHDIVQRLDGTWFRARWKDYKIQKQIITDPTIEAQWETWTDWITEADIINGPVALYHSTTEARLFIAYLTYNTSTNTYTVKQKESTDYSTFDLEGSVFTFTSPPYPGVSYAWMRPFELVIATHYTGIPDGSLSHYPMYFKNYWTFPTASPVLLSTSPRYPVLITTEDQGYTMDIVYVGEKAFVVSSFVPMDTYDPDVAYDVKLQGFWLGSVGDSATVVDWQALDQWSWGDMTQLLPTDTSDQLEWQSCPRISKIDDTYWLTFVHGDPAIGDHPTWSLDVMRSKDLIHWTDRTVLISGLGVNLEPYNLAPAEMIKSGDVVYLVTYDNVWTATATAAVGATTATDITADVKGWSVSIPDGSAGQAQFNVANRGNKYTNSTQLIAGADVTIQAGYNDGSTDHLVDIFTGVIDTNPRTDEVGRSEFQVTARDWTQKLKDWRSDRLWTIQSANRFRKDFDDTTDADYFLTIGDSTWTQANSVYTASKVDEGGWNYALAGTDVFTNCTVETRLRFDNLLAGYAGVLIRTGDTSLAGGYSVSLRVNETTVAMTYVSHTATTVTVNGDQSLYGTVGAARAYYIVVEATNVAWAFLGESSVAGGKTTFTIYDANVGGTNQWNGNRQPDGTVTSTVAYAWSSGQVVLMKNIAGVVTTKQYASFTFHTNTWYGLKVDARYGNIRAWVKSEWPSDSQSWVKYLDYDDGDSDIISAPGYVGLVARVTRADSTKSFDYFMVNGHETPKTVEYAVKHVATKAGILDINTSTTRYDDFSAVALDDQWMQPPAALGGHWEISSGTLHGYTDALTGQWTLLKNTYESRDVVMTFKMKTTDYGGVYVKATGRYMGYLIAVGWGAGGGLVTISEFIWPSQSTIIAYQDFPFNLSGLWGEYTVRVRENWISLWVNDQHVLTAYAPTYNGKEISLAAYSTSGAYFDDFRIAEMHEEVDAVVILPNDDGETVIDALKEVYGAHYFLEGDGALRLGVLIPSTPTSALAYGLTRSEMGQDNREWVSHVRVIGYQSESAGISVWADYHDTLVEQYLGRRYMEESRPECLTTEECYKTAQEIMDEHNRPSSGLRLTGRPYLELEPRDLVTYGNPLDGTDNERYFVTAINYTYEINDDTIKFHMETELEAQADYWPLFDISRFIGYGYGDRAPGTPPSRFIGTGGDGRLVVGQPNPGSDGAIVREP